MEIFALQPTNVNRHLIELQINARERRLFTLRLSAYYTQDYK